MVLRDPQGNRCFGYPYGDSLNTDSEFRSSGGRSYRASIADDSLLLATFVISARITSSYCAAADRSTGCSRSSEGA